MEHNAPHKSSAFEGYYSKFDLPSGAHIALIVCKVQNATFRPNKVSFTYVPKEDVHTKTYQKELFPDDMTMTILDPKTNAFEIAIPELGYVKWHADSTTEYDISSPSYTFKGKTTTRTPWSRTSNTPESWLVHLPLPLHWHVHSLASECDFSLSIPSYPLPAPDASNTALVHQEKNWAASFPSAHMWLQARKGDSSSLLRRRANPRHGGLPPRLPQQRAGARFPPSLRAAHGGLESLLELQDGLGGAQVQSQRAEFQAEDHSRG
ncbi:hypothetical protein Q7P37_001376 [Cladosporium fusiforme]